MSGNQTEQQGLLIDLDGVIYQSGQIIPGALEALDWMPKERDKSFMAGRIIGGAVDRTYTRVDGDRFQISRTAGMGPSVVCGGRVSEANGVAVIHLRVTFGVVSAGFWLLLAACLLLGATAYYFAGNTYMAVVLLGLSAVSFIWYRFWLWDAGYLRSALSEQLGGVEWTRIRG